MRRANAEVHLTANEYACLALLVQHCGKVVTRRHILREPCGPKAGENSHYLRIRINHLRRKLVLTPNQPRHLKTESGIGYRLVE